MAERTKTAPHRRFAPMRDRVSRFPVTHSWKDIVVKFDILLTSNYLSITKLSDSKRKRHEIIMDLHDRGYSNKQILQSLSWRINIKQDSINLSSTKLAVGEESAVYGPVDVGGGQVEPEMEELSKIIDIVNDRFKTDFTKADELFFDSVREDAVNDEHVRDAARVNTLDGPNYVFNKKTREETTV